MRRTVTLLVGLIALGPVMAAEVSEPLIELGIRQYRERKLREAVFTLDSAARRLSARYGETRERARVHLFLAAAYFGLEQPERGRESLRTALDLANDIDASKENLPGDVAKELEALRRNQSRAPGRSRVPLLLAVTVAGAAAGLPLSSALHDEAAPAASSNHTPQGRVLVAPEGAAIAGVTALTFTASVVDADGDPLSYEWSFGDGIVASGVSARHTYLRPGTFNVRLTATDFHGTPLQQDHTVTVRSLTGSWRQEPFAPYSFVQSGIFVESDEVSESPVGAGTRYWKGSLEHPRRVVLRLYHGTRTAEVLGPECVGEVDETVNTISCVSGLYLLQFRRQ
jgi:hypothetical protein